jgi:hypothetical protein
MTSRRRRRKSGIIKTSSAQSRDFEGMMLARACISGLVPLSYMLFSPQQAAPTTLWKEAHMRLVIAALTDGTPISSRNRQLPVLLSHLHVPLNDDAPCGEPRHVRVALPSFSFLSLPTNPAGLAGAGPGRGSDLDRLRGPPDHAVRKHGAQHPVLVCQVRSKLPASSRRPFRTKWGRARSSGRPRGRPP